MKLHTFIHIAHLYIYTCLFVYVYLLTYIYKYDSYVTYEHLHKRSSCKVVAPGLLQVQDLHDYTTQSAEPGAPGLDLTYALQVLPHTHSIGKAGASINELADEAIIAVGLGEGGLRVEEMRGAPKGALAIHALVPDQFRGTPLAKAKMHRRCSTIVDKIGKKLKVTFPAARRAGAGDAQSAVQGRLLMQVLLMDNERAAVSLTRCADADVGGTWPCWHLPAGLADVDLDKITQPMPSSAYRKLEEAFRTMQISPTATDHCVDLGASPGGWTKALRRYGASVTAVDRAELNGELMQDKLVTFVQGDAFAFSPLDTDGGGGGKAVDWMVSDAIPEPHRVPELLEAWCQGKWARRMVVTMKFKGDPDWEQLARAGDVAAAAGYAYRSKHFFNNKNEVTLMLAQMPSVEIVGDSEISGAKE